MSDSLAVLEAFYAAETEYVAGRADFSGMAAHLDPGVVMYQAECLLYGGEWSGHEGFERFMGEMSRAWSSLEMLEQRFAVDGNAVAVYNRVVFRARESGRELETSVMQWIGFKDGLITEVRPFYLDTRAVLEVLRARS
ncbi:nuclear transport factor 2 family protein [Actinomadura sp. 6N118]|uniref:nuclear transport factor 2 family protein n=1 Tax=Actinomadura sp. 6N118 TaxID=3375151 RepID=UPI0037B9E0A5